MSVFLTEEEDEKYGSRINIDTDGEIRDTGNDLSDKIKKAVEARLEEEKKKYPDMADDLVIADPEMENPTGMFSAWLISEKKMSPDAAFKVLKDSENYEEAIRILNFLKCFINIPSEGVPSTSVLREFIGNSYFE